jgi:predicted nucleic acid-binding protein
MESGEMMEGKLVLDTDVVIDYLRGQPDAVLFFKNNSDRSILSAIVVAELYAGVRGDSEEQMLDKLLSIHPIIPVTTEIAKAGGLLRRKFGKSHGVDVADAILAATTQAAEAELATLNVRHYPMFPGLRPAYAKK